MQLTKKVIAIMLLIGIPALILGQIIWPSDPTGPVPTSTQLPFFIFISLIEALLFGLGIAFILFGRHIFFNAKGNTTLNKLTFVSLAWLLVSWWPHDNMHRHNGMNLAGLLTIEYMFHATIILATLVLTYFCLTILKAQIKKNK